MLGKGSYCNFHLLFFRIGTDMIPVVSWIAASIFPLAWTNLVYFYSLTNYFSVSDSEWRAVVVRYLLFNVASPGVSNNWCLRLHGLLPAPVTHGHRRQACVWDRRQAQLMEQVYLVFLDSVCVFDLFWKRPIVEWAGRRWSVQQLRLILEYWWCKSRHPSACPFLSRPPSCTLRRCCWKAVCALGRQ